MQAGVNFIKGVPAMNAAEPAIRINVDPTNPGQFFACCGLLELAARHCQNAEGWFEGKKFCIAGRDVDNRVVGDLLKFLIQCKVDFQDAESKTSPLELGPPINLRLDWWLQEDGKPNLFKTWAANATSQHKMAGATQT
jgi:CRISPR-associated endonuclease/helicase Cas3